MQPWLKKDGGGTVYYMHCYITYFLSKIWQFQVLWQLFDILKLVLILLCSVFQYKFS